MDASRKEYLRKTYVHPIFDNQDWHRPARDHVIGNKFSGFRRHTGDFVNAVGQAMGEKITGIEWAHIHLSLWKMAGGQLILVMRSPGLLRDEYAKLLRERGIDPDGPILLAPRNTGGFVPSRSLGNPCGEISLRKEYQAMFHNKETHPMINITNTSTPPAPPAFETVVKHYIYGKDVATMSDEQLINAIKKIEAEIDALGDIQTTSKKVEAKVEELKTMLASVVEVLDAK